MHEVFRLWPVSICFQYSKKFHKKTFSFCPPKITSIIGTTENALLHYTKKQKWSYRMKRVINNKTKKLFPCKYCTTGKLEMSALFTAGLSKLPKQH